MRKVCDMCGGTGRKQADMPFTGLSPVCPMCDGNGYVDDMVYQQPTRTEVDAFVIDRMKEVDRLRKRLDKIIQHAQAIIINGGNNNLACKMLRIASGQEDGDDT